MQQGKPTVVNKQRFGLWARPHSLLCILSYESSAAIATVYSHAFSPNVQCNQILVFHGNTLGKIKRDTVSTIKGKQIFPLFNYVSTPFSIFLSFSIFLCIWYCQYALWRFSHMQYSSSFLFFYMGYLSRILFCLIMLNVFHRRTVNPFSTCRTTFL